MTNLGSQFKELQAPFAAKDVHFRVGNVTQDKTKGTAFAFIKTDAIRERLDEVFTPAGWEVSYEPADSVGDQNGVKCILRILCDGNWIAKEDVGTASDYEQLKGAYSDAFKRAANAWGIGRYLKAYKSQWFALDQSGRFHTQPQLPVELLVKGEASNQMTDQPSVQEHTHTTQIFNEHAVQNSAEPQSNNQGEFTCSIDPLSLPENDQNYLNNLFEQVLTTNGLHKFAAVKLVREAQLSEDAKIFAINYLQQKVA
tara:strand:+ start:9181 stop:9945 length:765 start_codon:yes stop_codon:yes gene_type:complete